MARSASKSLPMLGGDDSSWRWLEVAPDAMLIVNHAGQIVRMNEQAEHLFGYTRLELIGQPLETLLPNIRVPFINGAAKVISPIPRPARFARTHVIKLGTRVVMNSPLRSASAPCTWARRPSSSARSAT